MLRFFRKKHPFIFDSNSVAIPSIIGFIIILLFAPFQIREVGLTERIIAAVVIGVLIALGILFSVKGIKKIFPSLLLEDEWTVGKEFLLVIFVLFNITLLLFAAFLLVKPNQESIPTLYVEIVTITLAISVLPILISILFEQYKFQRTKLKTVTALTESLKTRNTELLEDIKKTARTQQLLLIKSENNDIELQLKPHDLVYLKSDGNYIEIYFRNRDEIHKKILRNRLKVMEDALPAALFFRSHNRYIVNGIYIVKISGNSRKLLLHLKDVPTPIPVSRAKAKSITEFLEYLQK